MARPIPLNPGQHQNTRIRNEIDFSRFSAQQVLPVTIYEFAQAGSDAPVLFIKNSETGQFQTVQLLGLKTGENLMFQDGKWQGNYIPGLLQLDPLRLMETAPGSEDMAVGIDMDSPLVGEAEGERLFNDDGQPTEFLEKRREMIGKYFEHSQVTNAFIGRLTELDLLSQQELTLDLKGQKFSLSGLYLVNEQKLRELPDEDLLQLARSGLLYAINCHLMSQHQVRNLARLAVAQGD